jgi:hypothetical protein
MFNNAIFKHRGNYEKYVFNTNFLSIGGIGPSQPPPLLHTRTFFSHSFTHHKNLLVMIAADMAARQVR